MGVEEDARWAEIDALLFEGLRIQALAAARSQFGLSLVDAIESVHERWRQLVETRPGAFSVPIDGYWDNVYT